MSSESQSRLQLVEEELSQLNSILEDHKWWMKREIEDCVGEMAALRSVVAEVEEGNKLTEAVNNATQSQLQVCYLIKAHLIVTNIELSSPLRCVSRVSVN